MPFQVSKAHLLCSKICVYDYIKVSVAHAQNLLNICYLLTIVILKDKSNQLTPNINTFLRNIFSFFHPCHYQLPGIIHNATLPPPPPPPFLQSPYNLPKFLNILHIPSHFPSPFSCVFFFFFFLLFFFFFFLLIMFIFFFFFLE